MNLLIDIGNSRVKWALAPAGDKNLVPRGLSVKSLDTTTLANAWQDMATPGRVLVSTVGGDNISFMVAELCRQKWNLTPAYARVTRSFDGLECGYSDLSRLGVDRWLAMMAAWVQHRGACLVVDCGTAVTMDAIDDQGQHLGGYILPGFAMMQSMLAEHTQRIGQDDVGTVSGGFATDTAEAVAGGARLALISSIDAACKHMESQLGYRPQCLITGGGSSTIVNHLDGEYSYEEALVLQGLQVMASGQ